MSWRKYWRYVIVKSKDTDTLSLIAMEMFTIDWIVILLGISFSKVPILNVL